MPAWRGHASASSWPATRWSCSTATAARDNRRGAASIISRIEGFTGPSFLHDLPPWVAWVVGRGYAPDAAKIGLLWSIVVMPSARRMGRAQRNPSPRDRKSTRRTPVTNAQLVCRLLLEKKKQTHT